MEDMDEVALGTINNWCKGVIVWNLMLDNDRGPNREGGCQTCYGAVDINNSDYKTIIRNSHYYIIAHLSSVVKPGAVRIATTGYTDNGTKIKNVNKAVLQSWLGVTTITSQTSDPGAGSSLATGSILLVYA